MGTRTTAAATAATSLALVTALAAAAPAQAAGPGAGTGRGVSGLICPGDTSASPFAFSLAGRAWSAAQEVGGSRVLVPTSFALATYEGDPTDPSTYQLVDPRVIIFGIKAQTDGLGTTACILDGSQSTDGAEPGGFVAVVVNGILQ